jgi:hypothetical protein
MKWLSLLTNRAFVSAVMIIAGNILMLIYGRDFGLDEKLTETIITVAGGILQAMGFTGAVTYKKEQEDEDVSSSDESD